MNPERPHLDKDRLLKRWLTGDATRKDERKLESFAQDDPFLADAMEGYNSLPENEHAESVTKLKSRLRERTDKQRGGVVFYMLRIAAVGVVVLAAWLVFQQVGGQAEKSAPASISEARESASQSFDAPELKPQDGVVSDAAETGDEQSDISQAEKEEVPNPMKDIVKERKAKKKTETGAPRLAEEEVAEKAENLRKESESKKRVAEADADEASKIVEPSLAVEPAPAETEAFDDTAFLDFEESPRAGNSAPMVHKIVGQVTNDFGDPLTGASVVEEESQKGTVTDKNGYFAIETEANQPNLRISYLGYEEKNLAYRDEDFLNVKLDESGAALEEVSVTALSKKPKASPHPPQPKGGFAKLEKYIRKNLRRPDYDSEVTGEVKLRFRIQSDGTPTDFEVLNSLGEFFDEEAKRLLREGPKWENVSDDGVTYAIKF